MSRTGRVVIVVVVLLAGLALTLFAREGGTPGSANAERGQDIDLARLVDPDSGQINLPLEAYSLSYRELRTIEYARDLLLAQCLRARGFSWVHFDRRSEPERVDTRYGPWTRQHAARYGYGGPPPTPAEQALEAENQRVLAPEEIAARSTCSDRVNEVTLVEPLPGDIAAFDVYQPVLESPEGRALIEEWRRCMSEHGIRTSEKYDEVWSPPGIPPELNEEQIRIALVDVDCKTRTDLVRRMAALEARAQLAIIREHESDLAAQRDVIDDVVAAAERVIIDHG